MDSLSYTFEDGTKYVVLHNGDWSGEATFLILENDEPVAQTEAYIEDVQETILVMMENGRASGSITIGQVAFNIDGIICLLCDMASNRITSLLEENKLDLEQLVRMEYEVDAP